MGNYPLRKEDVVESFIRSSGPGGQNVNKVASCVELVHVLTGIRVKCQKFRTQQLNRQEAWRLLQETIDDKFAQELKTLKQQKERIKRQNRKRTKSSKEIMLENKRKRSIKKLGRRKNSYDQE